ncbi:hypothetical protein AB6A23_08630 [Paenibacillus tarimensis]
MKRMWLILRSISVPFAIIIGWKPMFDGVFDLQDFIFPVGAIIAIISWYNLNRLNRKEKDGRVETTDAGGGTDH